jgi:uncharacterized protein
VAGFARGEADVSLSPEEGGTALAYTARATIGGKLAQIGQRLIDGAAKQIADDFFSRFSAVLATEPPSPNTVAPVATVEPPPAPASEDTERIAPADRPGVGPEIWVVGLIAVIAILLFLFGVTL